MMNFTIFNYNIRIGMTARWPWSCFKIHKYDYSRHLVWGKLSICVENWALEVHPICKECKSTEISEVSSGDESLTVCQACNSIEQGYEYVNLHEYEKLS